MPKASPQTSLRRATRADIDRLWTLIDLSVRELHAPYYTPAQIERSLAEVYEVDPVLVDDGTYYVLEEDGELVACGGWSKHTTLCAGHNFARPADERLDPAQDAAKIRAFFVRPSHARRGLASLLLEHCESEARAAGFRRAELGATLSGVPFYAARGYVATADAEVALSSLDALRVVLMERNLELPEIFPRT
jgi:GNAT superfamily N-acetyltransferase